MDSLRIPQRIKQRMNVSAQPKLSPFRYPGGKTRLGELVHYWLMCGPKVNSFTEPFAGGASVGLYVATKGLAKKVKLVEIDEDVAAVWQTILSEDYSWLCKKIGNYTPTRGRVLDLLTSAPRSTRERAFKTLVRNRVARSGLLWNGAGISRSGERGDGLSSRWYPTTLVKRIEHIHLIRRRISFKHGCGLEEIKKASDDNRNALFVDPPYSTLITSAGRRLYRHNEIDHAHLFALLAKGDARFLMTHENSGPVRALVSDCKMESAKLPVLTAQNKFSKELLIGVDLSKLYSKFKFGMNDDRNLKMGLDFL